MRVKPLTLALRVSTCVCHSEFTAVCSLTAACVYAREGIGTICVCCAAEHSEHMTCDKSAEEHAKLARTLHSDEGCKR